MLNGRRRIGAGIAGMWRDAPVPEKRVRLLPDSEPSHGGPDLLDASMLSDDSWDFERQTLYNLLW